MKMKIRIEVDDKLTEEEVVIYCPKLTDTVAKVQKAVADASAQSKNFIVYKGDVEYYIGLEDILFFETEGSIIDVHTKDEIYETNYRLYELEELLPTHFMRISKSTILNANEVYAIHRNLSSSSIVEFQNTHKQVYVSRRYYKDLKEKLEEKRMRK